MSKWSAILLLGPTGVGKSPLGDLLSEKGLLGKRCLHFDFGQQLRSIAYGPSRKEFLPSERIFIQKVLEEGLLLEDQHFPLALKILRFFLASKKAQGNELLVMNGLPRHQGQAEALRPWVAINTVVVLEASFEEVLERIHKDVGGDRKGRRDDYIELIYKKWLTYRERTRPLINYYQKIGTPVAKILVGRKTSPVETYYRLVHTLKQNHHLCLKLSGA